MDQHLLRNKLLWWLLAFDLGVVNIGLGYLLYQSHLAKVSSSVGSQTTKIVDECGVACQGYIDAQIAQALVMPTPRATTVATPTSTLTPRLVAPTAAKTRTVAYVTVPGTGSTTANVWTSLSGTDFYFNPADYPGLVEVYFEINARLMNGNGFAYFQLYDATHGIGVQGSDITTANQTSTALSSGKVSFWAGKNLIKVQAKSLTADTAIFDSGRLRIVTEN